MIDSLINDIKSEIRICFNLGVKQIIPKKLKV